MLFYCPNNYCVNDTGERLDGKNKEGNYNT